MKRCKTKRCADTQGRGADVEKNGMASPARRPAALLIAGVFSLVIAARLDAQPAPTAEGFRFRFSLAPGETLSLDKYQDIRIFNGLTWNTREEKNRIVLKVVGREQERAVLEGAFLTYSREPRRTGEFRRDRDFASRFTIGESGDYIVGDEYLMPNLRSLPAFPDRPLQIGERWQAPAMETMDLPGVRLRVPVVAEYQYTGPAPLTMPDGAVKEFDRITYTYSYTTPARSPAVRSITGQSSCELWFDREAGTPVFDANRLVYVFHMIDGSVQEYHFRIDSWWRKTVSATEDDRERIAAEVREQLGQEGENELAVRASEDGVTIDLSDILFEHNSAELSAGARRELARVARVLQRFPEREVRISGHTDSSGADAYNQRLSENRARAVVRALQQEHGVDGRRLSYRGYGETKPVASNATPEGRQRNRRVEVLIVTD